MIIPGVSVNMIHLIEMPWIFVFHKQHGDKPMNKITASVAIGIVKSHQFIAFVTCPL